MEISIRQASNRTISDWRDLISLLAPKGDAEAARSSKVQADKAVRARDKEISASQRGGKKHAGEHKALRFDFAEGLLEIGLVLSSPTSLPRMLFPRSACWPA